MECVLITYIGDALDAMETVSMPFVTSTHLIWTNFSIQIPFNLKGTTFRFIALLKTFVSTFDSVFIKTDHL